VEPAIAARPMIAVAVAIGLTGLAARLIRPWWGRVIALAGVAVVAAGVGVQRVTGRLPDPRPWRWGGDGDSPLDYALVVADLVEATVVAWSTTLLPAASDQHPLIGPMVWAIFGLVCLVLALALLAFRLPFPAIAAAALPVAIHVIVLTPDETLPLAVGLAFFALITLALTRGGGVGGAPRIALAAVTLTAVAVAIAAGPARVDSATWAWRSWAPERPQPVSVQFVWNQSYRALEFPEREQTVLVVPAAFEANLQVAALSRFNGVRWSIADRTVAGGADGGAAVPDPEAVGIETGGEAEEVLEIENVALASRRVPAPAGTTAVAGISPTAGTVGVTGAGFFTVERPLPLGSSWTATYAADAPTPTSLDEDVVAVGEANLFSFFADDPIVGRVPSEQSAVDIDAGDSFLDPLLIVGDVIFPADGVPDRDAIVRRLLDERAARSDPLAGDYRAWARAYEEIQPVIAEATTPYQRVVLLENWFQTAFAYDETASYGEPGGIGPLPAFLESSTRAAHCQYFAGSMAVLLRMLGIPTRVAVGFTGGRTRGDERLITDRGAHAWVEVRFAEAGWVAFEPTPTRRLAAATSSTSTAFLDSGLALGPGALSALARERGGEGPGGPGGTSGGGGGGGVADDEPRRAWLVGAAAALVLGLLVPLVIWVRKERGFTQRRRGDDPRSAAIALRREVEGWLVDQGVEIPAAATLTDIGRGTRQAFGVDADPWVEVMVAARYGAGADREAARRARRATGELRRELRARLTRTDRLRGAIRPRRLRS
jgi:transglutaminase-like putative cysteine protease